MNCRECQELIHPYVDSELDLTQTLRIESHLRDCASCAAVHENLMALRSSLRDGSLYYRAPSALERSIRAKVGGSKFRARRVPLSYWLGSLAAVLVVGVAAWLIASRPGGNAEQVLASEVTSAHVRSLMVEHLWDVKSTDQHTVKPWFDGKLDFAPQVRDFAGSSFALQGGRLDYLAGRPVAALIYRHEKHYINVFVWPAAREVEGSDGVLSQQGYNTVHFVHSKMNYWVISDASADTVRRLAELLRG